MTANTIRQILAETAPPLNLFTSDGRIIYIDHPESVLITADLLALGSGVDVTTGLAKEAILVAPEHVVRIEKTRRRALRKVA